MYKKILNNIISWWQENTNNTEETYHVMKRGNKSEWLIFESPIGEPNIKYTDDEYYIERKENDDYIIWFGQSINWKRNKPDGKWTVLTKNEDSKPLEDYLPEIVYGEDRHIFVECETPIYEKFYQKLK